MIEKRKEHYHFIGIGGIGMGSLASLFADQGCYVTGSDMQANKMTEYLKSKNIHVFLGHHSTYVGDAQYVVYSSAINKNNPEIQQAKKKGIPVFQRAEVLAKLMDQKKGIAVAGTHGKTTTSSMVAHILTTAGLSPTVAVGGIINNGDFSASIGQGEYFVAEVDESDGSFLFFNPFYSILTNIDFEHIDFYGSWENIVEAYKKFIKKTHDLGELIVCGDDPVIREMLPMIKKKYCTYGFAKHNDYHVQSLSCEGFESLFECAYQKTVLGSIRLSVPGRHNVLNALACVALSHRMGVAFPIVQRSLSSYQGVQRRFTVHYKKNDLMLVEDYGHHPTEILATISAARLLNPRRLIVVFQPHRFSRTKFLMNQFVDVLQHSDYLIITDIYAASEDPIEGIDSQEMLNQIFAKGKRSAIYLKKEKILDHLELIVKAGDLILVMGAGNINQIIEKLIVSLDEK